MSTVCAKIRGFALRASSGIANTMILLDCFTQTAVCCIAPQMLIVEGPLQKHQA
jgi:hypothetical protein